MSHYVTIACDKDVPGLGLCMSEDSPLGMPASATEARRKLSRADRPWHRNRAGEDICPDCWEAGRR